MGLSQLKSGLVNSVTSGGGGGGAGSLLSDLVDSGYEDDYRQQQYQYQHQHQLPPLPQAYSHPYHTVGTPPAFYIVPATHIDSYYSRRGKRSAGTATTTTKVGWVGLY